MTRKPTKSGNIRLPPGSDLPSDKNVTLPRQIKHEAAVANALATGQPVPSKPKPVARQGFPHSDAEIDKGLQRLKALQTNDPELEVIRSLAEEGARHIKARRRGAQQPRENSYEVTRRMEAVLQSFREKSSKLQKYPTGEKTIAAVRQSVIQKLGVED